MLYLALVTAAAVLGAFIALSILACRQSGPRAHDAAPSAGHVAPRVIQNSSIIYRLGLVALAPLLAWGIGGELWPAAAYLVSMGLGLSLFYALRRPILQFLEGALVHDRSITVHEFIARRHGNDPRVRAFAAALTVFAIYGLIVCVMIGLSIVLRTVFSGSGGIADLFVVAIFLVVASFTLASGRLGILYATQIQLGLTYFGLFAATVFLLYLQGSAIGAMPLKGIVALALIVIVCAVVHFRRRARYLDTSVRPGAASANGPREREPTGVRLFVRLQKILNSLVGILAMTLIVLAAIVTAFELFLGGAPAFAREALDALRSGTSVSAMTLISLIVLPLLHPMVDVVNWQWVAPSQGSASRPVPGRRWTAAFRTSADLCARGAVDGAFHCPVRRHRRVDIGGHVRRQRHASLRGELACAREFGSHGYCVAFDARRFSARGRDDGVVDRGGSRCCRQRHRADVALSIDIGRRHSRRRAGARDLDRRACDRTFGSGDFPARRHRR